MPIITKIEPQKSKKRVNIYFDGEFGFGIDLENYMKLKLKVGEELSDDEVQEIIKKGEFQKAFDKILRFATLRPRSKKEIKDRLNKYKVSESLHEELFNRLKRLNLLDDEEFAKWWVGQRLQFKFRSKMELISELRKKGIDRKTIDQVVNRLVDEENQEESAKLLLEKRSFAWRKYKGWEKKKKMSDYLARKGFSWDVIKKVVD